MNSERVFSRIDYEKMMNIFDTYSVQDETEKKLLEALKMQIMKSKPVDEKKIKENIVTVNSKIILRNIGNGTREEVHLVFPGDYDKKSKKISVLSGIGAQILGNKIGAVIRECSSSEKYYMIEDIIYRPESYQ